MAQPVTFSRERFLNGLEDEGEERVRLNLATNRYDDTNDMRALVLEWLAQKERGRASYRHNELMPISRQRRLLQPWLQSAPLLL
jgi:hypothetical protein